MIYTLNQPPFHHHSLNHPWLHCHAEERAAKFKTVGALATAFVTAQEQGSDSEAGHAKGGKPTLEFVGVLVLQASYRSRHSVEI